MKTIEIKTLAGEVKYSSTTATNLREAVIEAVGSNANLNYADLSGANLNYADLSNANLNYADLSGANLFDANLCGADLSNANLCDADLSGAEMQNAKFFGKGGTKPLKRSQLPDFLAALGFFIEE